MSLFQSLLLCVVAVGIVYGSGDHCCVSSQFNAKMRVETASFKYGTKPTVSVNTFMIDYDRDMKMDRVMGTVYLDVGGDDAMALNYTTINDYGNGMSYNYGVYNGYPYCNATQIDPKDMNDGCIPSSLNYTGSFTLGSKSNSVMINSFDGMMDDLSWSIQVTENECTPIYFSRYGKDKDGTFMRENGIYVNFVQNATISTGAFTIPDSCKTAGK